MKSTKVFFLYFTFLFLFSCTAVKRNNGSWVILIKQRLFNKETNTSVVPAYTRDIMAWYKDSLVICEGDHVDIETDSSGKETWKNYPGEYTFIDLRERSFYEYYNFSDTARIVDTYLQRDSGRTKRGWNFFSNQAFFSPEAERLSDTIINRIKYQRLRDTKIIDISNPEEQKIFGKKQVQVKVGYIRCDLKTPVFSSDKIFEKKTGCVIIRTDYINPPGRPNLIVEIEYVRNKLTAAERKVFKAWERNAKKNPVEEK